jgi:putative membrane protein
MARNSRLIIPTATVNRKKQAKFKRPGFPGLFVFRNIAAAAKQIQYPDHELAAAQAPISTNGKYMLDNLAGFFIQWGITSLSLWVASLLFNGIRFSSTGSLIISALLLGFANAVLRPLLVILTLPLTLVTLGFFLLVINALMLLLVAKVVSGFKISGFWTAFFASLFISILSMALGSLVPNAEMTVYRLPTQAPQTISM